MHIRRRHRSAPKYTYTQGSEPTSAKKALNLTLLLTLAALCLFLSGAVMFLKTLSSQIAVSDASDIVIDKVNSAIADIMLCTSYKTVIICHITALKAFNTCLCTFGAYIGILTGTLYNSAPSWVAA